MDKPFEIFFTDLTQSCQDKLLDAYGISDPLMANWDVFPVVSILIDEDEMNVNQKETSSNIVVIPNGHFIDEDEDAYDVFNGIRID